MLLTRLHPRRRGRAIVVTLASAEENMQRFAI
jgi:hypothetical protein